MTLEPDSRQRTGRSRLQILAALGAAGLLLVLVTAGVTTLAVRSSDSPLRSEPVEDAAPDSTPPTTVLGSPASTEPSTSSTPTVEGTSGSPDSSDAAPQVYSPPSTTWSKPPLGRPTNDATYQTVIRRVTSAEGTRFNRNTYSRRQAENADGTRFFSYHGAAEYRVYDRRSLAELAVLDIHPDGEPQWHPTDPDLVRHLSGDDSSTGSFQLLQTDVMTGASEVVADLTNHLAAIFPNGRYLTDLAEGSPSADGNRYAWVVHDASERPVGIVSYDLAADKVLGTLPLPEGHDGPKGRIDWVSASPTGEHVMASHWDGTYAYDIDLTNERLVYSSADHSDIALSSNGQDVYVYIDFSAGTNGGWLVADNLHTGTKTQIFDLYRTDSNTSIHVSGKGYKRPGWVIVSTYSCKVDAGWACNKVLAVELEGAQQVIGLADTYNCGESYWTEPHAVVNQSFTRVLFNSDGGSCGIDAEVYEVDLPNLG